MTQILSLTEANVTDSGQEAEIKTEVTDLITQELPGVPIEEAVEEEGVLKGHSTNLRNKTVIRVHQKQRTTNRPKDLREVAAITKVIISDLISANVEVIVVVIEVAVVEVEAVVKDIRDINGRLQSRPMITMMRLIKTLNTLNLNLSK